VKETFPKPDLRISKKELLESNEDIYYEISR
jgi:hypothetical protein